MAAAQQEQTAVLMAQLEQFEHQSRLDQMQREVLKQARSLIVDMTNAALEVVNKPKEELILSCIEADALVQSFNNAISGGLNVSLFEDINDIERFRALEKIMSQLSVMNQRLSQNQREAKEKLLLYRQEIPILEEAAIIADVLPVLEDKVERIKEEHEQALPKWRALIAKKRKKNAQVERNTLIMGVVVTVICISAMIMPEIDASYFGLFAADEWIAESIAGGSCCLLILAISGLLSYRENRTRVILDYYESLEESENPYDSSFESSNNDDLEERLEMYLEFEDEDPGLWTEEIKQIRRKLNSEASASSVGQISLSLPPYSIMDIDLDYDADDDFDDDFDAFSSTRYTDTLFELSFRSLHGKYSTNAPKVRALRSWLSELMDYYEINSVEEFDEQIESRNRFMENLSNEMFQSEEQTGQLPEYSLQGEIHDSGYEVIQYPEGFGEWYWKDTSSEKWVLWE